MSLREGALGPLGQGIETLAGLANSLDGALVPDPPATIAEGGMIRDGYCQDLDQLRLITRDGKGWIVSMRWFMLLRAAFPGIRRS